MTPESRTTADPQASAITAESGRASLEDLREALLNPPPIERDAMGHWYNPALPDLDEGVDVALFLLAFSLDCAFVTAENQMDTEAYDAMLEADSGSIMSWQPTPPEGEGWTPLSIHDTEDGGVASYVRPLNREGVKDAIAVIAAEHAGRRTWAERRLKTANAEIAVLRRQLDQKSRDVAAPIVPTPQQISDYLGGIAAIQRRLAVEGAETE